MESPTIKRLPMVLGVQASTLEMKYQCAAVCVEASVTAISAAFTALPNCHQLFVRLPGWLVIEFVVWPVARYAVTVMTCWALMGKLMGSETANAPLGMLMESFSTLR